MLFEKKASIESSSYRRRYLARMYDRLNTVKTAFNDYTVTSSSYDPYQLKQYAEEVQYDPYQLRVRYGKKVPAEKDQYPPTKRLRSMAAAALESISHALIYGAFAAYSYVCSDRKNSYIGPDAEPITKNQLEVNNDDIISQDDYIMDFTPTTTKPVIPIQAPKKRPNSYCSCSVEHDLEVDESAPRQLPMAQQSLDDSVYHDSAQQLIESQLHESLCESVYEPEYQSNQHEMESGLYKSVYRPNTVHSVYQAWPQQIYQPPVYHQSDPAYNMRQNLTPIVRESNVLQTFMELLEEKPPKRTFDDIDDALDDTWEYVDKTSLAPPKPPRRVFRRK